VKRLLVEQAIASLTSLKSSTSAPDLDLLKLFPGAGVLKEAGIFGDKLKPLWMVEARTTIQNLLSPSEFASLQNVGMLNQHFTSSGLIDQMWRFVFEKTDYRCIKVLDPGCGIGGFYHHCPHPDLVEYVGVEIDPTSASIAKATVRGSIYCKDFLRWNHPTLFDLAIGNVPFVNGVKKIALDERKVSLEIHAQFFIKALSHLKSGGLIVFLTTTSTLDSCGADSVFFREWVSDRAHFLGAVRLPCRKATHIGGTEVTTDLVIFQKK
jgi:SAM-dependent methyltransferase